MRSKGEYARKLIYVSKASSALGHCIAELTLWNSRKLKILAQAET